LRPAWRPQDAKAIVEQDKFLAEFLHDMGGAG